jgi:hypothetical protein
MWINVSNWRTEGVIACEIRKRSARDGILSCIEELKATIAAGVVDLEIRKRSARVQVLQTRLDGMLALSAARALVYADYPGGGATGMLVKDYRGKNAEQEIWKFDAALEAQIKDTLKQAAIEEGQWTEARSEGRRGNERDHGAAERRPEARGGCEGRAGCSGFHKTQPRRVLADKLTPRAQIHQSVRLVGQSPADHVVRPIHHA